MAIDLGDARRLCAEAERAGAFYVVAHNAGTRRSTHASADSCSRGSGRSWRASRCTRGYRTLVGLRPFGVRRFLYENLSTSSISWSGSSHRSWRSPAWRAAPCIRSQRLRHLGRLRGRSHRRLTATGHASWLRPGADELVAITLLSSWRSSTASCTRRASCRGRHRRLRAPLREERWVTWRRTARSSRRSSPAAGLFFRPPRPAIARARGPCASPLEAARCDPVRRLRLNPRTPSRSS